jgi:pimeloyl-ACP methyl ester carboxylesterase
MGVRPTSSIVRSTTTTWPRTRSPEHAVEMFRAIPGARLCVIPNAGHGAMPEETVLAFLQEEVASQQ